MRNNGGKIGGKVDLDAFDMSGKFDIVDLHNAKLDGNWPADPQITSMTYNTTWYRLGDNTISISTIGIPANTTLYWTTTEQSVAYATDSGIATSGSFVLNASRQGTITINPNIPKDGDLSQVTFKFEIRTGSTSGTILATTDTITLVASTFSITGSTTIGESDTSTQYTFTATGVNALTGYSVQSTLYSGETKDVVGSASVTISGNTTSANGPVFFRSNEDFFTGGDSVYDLKVVRNGYTLTFIRITIQDLSQSPTFTSNTASVSENGGTIQYSAYAPGSSGKTFNWAVTGHNVVASSGTATGALNDYINIFVTLAEDAVQTSSTISGNVSFATETIGTRQIATLPSVSVSETSPTITQILLTSEGNPFGSGSSTEGETVTVQIQSGTNLTGRSFGWSIVHNTTNSSDFQTTSGTFSGSSPSFTFNTSQDYTSESTESFRISITYLGTQIYLSPLQSLFDDTASFNTIDFRINNTQTPLPTTIDENPITTYTVGVYGGNYRKTYDVEFIGDVSASDFSLIGTTQNPTSLVTSYTGGSTPLQFKLSEDLLTEGTETFQLRYTWGGLLIGTSDVISISDTSQGDGNAPQPVTTNFKAFTYNPNQNQIEMEFSRPTVGTSRYFSHSDAGIFMQYLYDKIKNGQTGNFTYLNDNQSASVAVTDYASYIYYPNSSSIRYVWYVTGNYSGISITNIDISNFENGFTHNTSTSGNYASQAYFTPTNNSTTIDNFILASVPSIKLGSPFGTYASSVQAKFIEGPISILGSNTEIDVSGSYIPFETSVYLRNGSIVDTYIDGSYGAVGASFIGTFGSQTVPDPFWGLPSVNDQDHRFFEQIPRIKVHPPKKGIQYTIPSVSVDGNNGSPLLTLTFGADANGYKKAAEFFMIKYNELRNDGASQFDMIDGSYTYTISISNRYDSWGQNDHSFMWTSSNFNAPTLSPGNYSTLTFNSPTIKYIPQVNTAFLSYVPWSPGDSQSWGSYAWPIDSIETFGNYSTLRMFDNTGSTSLDQTWLKDIIPFIYYPEFSINFQGVGSYQFRSLRSFTNIDFDTSNPSGVLLTADALPGSYGGSSYASFSPGFIQVVAGSNYNWVEGDRGPELTYDAFPGTWIDQGGDRLNIYFSSQSTAESFRTAFNSANSTRWSYHFNDGAGAILDVNPFGGSYYESTGRYALIGPVSPNFSDPSTRGSYEVRLVRSDTGTYASVGRDWARRTTGIFPNPNNGDSMAGTWRIYAPGAGGGGGGGSPFTGIYGTFRGSYGASLTIYYLYNSSRDAFINQFVSGYNIVTDAFEFTCNSPSQVSGQATSILNFAGDESNFNGTYWQGVQPFVEVGGTFARSCGIGTKGFNEGTLFWY